MLRRRYRLLMVHCLTLSAPDVLTWLIQSDAQQGKRTMTITGAVIKNIIRKLLAGEDYRAEIVALIDAEFLQYVVDFFRSRC